MDENEKSNALEVHKVVQAFLGKHTAGEIKTLTARKMIQEGWNVSGYKEVPGGPAGHTVRGFLLQEQDVDTGLIREAVPEIMRQLGIPSEWVPPAVVVRDALPLLVQLKRVLLPVTGGYIARKDEFIARLGREARQFETADEPLHLSAEELHEIAQRVLPAEFF